jgi:hypothetical protein
MNARTIRGILRNNDRDFLARLAREVMSSAAERVTDGHRLYTSERAREGAAVVMRLAPLRDAIGWEDEPMRKPGGWELPGDLAVDCLPLLLEEKRSECRRISNSMAQACRAGDFLGELISRDSLSSVRCDIDVLIGIRAKLRAEGFEARPGRPQKELLAQGS